MQTAHEATAEAGHDLSRRDILTAGLGLGAAVGLTAFLPGLAGVASAAARSSVPLRKQVYVEVSALSSLAYFIDHRLGMTLAGRDLGVTTQYVGPSNLDLTAMLNIIDQKIAQKVSGLLVVGFDPILKSGIDKAVNAGIPVATLDADVPDSKRQIFLGTGNFNVGKLGGQLLAQAIGGKGKVAIITRIGQSNLEERVAGYKATLASYPHIQLVQVANDDSDSVKAASVVGSILRTHPDMAGIACVEAAGGVGAATAVQEAGKVGKVKIISMDRDDQTLNFIQRGVILASTAQKTALMSYLGTLILYYYANHPVPIVSNNAAAHVTPLPASVDTGTIVITKDNAHFFYHNRKS
jgi:ribose transport system substrate-binding protein